MTTKQQLTFVLIISFAFVLTTFLIYREIKEHKKIYNHLSASNTTQIIQQVVPNSTLTKLRLLEANYSESAFSELSKVYPNNGHLDAIWAAHYLATYIDAEHNIIDDVKFTEVIERYKLMVSCEVYDDYSQQTISTISNLVRPGAGQLLINIDQAFWRILPDAGGIRSFAKTIIDKHEKALKAGNSKGLVDDFKLIKKILKQRLQNAKYFIDPLVCCAISRIILKSSMVVKVLRNNQPQLITFFEKVAKIRDLYRESDFEFDQSFFMPAVMKTLKGKEVDLNDQDLLSLRRLEHNYFEKWIFLLASILFAAVLIVLTLLALFRSKSITSWNNFKITNTIKGLVLYTLPILVVYHLFKLTNLSSYNHSLYTHYINFFAEVSLVIIMIFWLSVCKFFNLFENEPKNIFQKYLFDWRVFSFLASISGFAYCFFFYITNPGKQNLKLLTMGRSIPSKESYWYISMNWSWIQTTVLILSVVLLNLVLASTIFKIVRSKVNFFNLLPNMLVHMTFLMLIYASYGAIVIRNSEANNYKKEKLLNPVLNGSTTPLEMKITDRSKRIGLE